jgi:hypothetical protein
MPNIRITPTHIRDQLTNQNKYITNVFHTTDGTARC